MRIILLFVIFLTSVSCAFRVAPEDSLLRDKAYLAVKFNTERDIAFWKYLFLRGFPTLHFSSGKSKFDSFIIDSTKKGEYSVRAVTPGRYRLDSIKFLIFTTTYIIKIKEPVYFDFKKDEIKIVGDILCHYKANTFGFNRFKLKKYSDGFQNAKTYIETHFINLKYLKIVNGYPDKNSAKLLADDDG